MAGKIMIVASDLHIGAGRYDDGNMLEDFTSDRAFADWLCALARESESSGRPAELIVNGDFVEFLQVPARSIFDPRVAYGAEDYRDMGESASARKLRLVIAGHPRVFEALRGWLHADAPRRTLTITKGNHDPHWQWTAVQDTLREAVGASGDRQSLLAFPPAGIARDGVYIEHGNQYGEVANRFTNLAAPYAPNNPAQLETPWGSRFVIEFFNRVERDRYWVDGVKPYSALLWYALAYDPPFAFRTLVALLRAAPKLAGVRVELLDAWLTNLQTDPARAAARFNADALYREEVMAFVAHLLDGVEPFVRARAETPEREPPEELAQRVAREQDGALVDAADRLAREQNAAIVLFGHTHRPVDQALPGGARYLNTGTWTWLLDLQNAGPAVWRDLFAHPAHYANRRRLNYARIDYDDGGVPNAQLLAHESPGAEGGRSLAHAGAQWLERVRRRLGR